MSRKRKSDPSTPTETPAANTEAPVADSATAVAEPPAEPIPQATFADRVGQTQPAAPDPYPLAKDNLAGVRLFDSRQDRQVAIKFNEKPSQAVIDKMKEAGFRWNAADQIWAQPVRGDSALGTRIKAEQLYQEVRHMIREEKGIDETRDIPF
jgi:hypothetical protein